jgi:hypothetical protein
LPFDSVRELLKSLPYNLLLRPMANDAPPAAIAATTPGVDTAALKVRSCFLVFV